MSEQAGKPPAFRPGSSHPTINALGDPDIDALQTGPVDGPSYIEIRARGSSRKDEADFLAVIGWLLEKGQFESHPCDTHPPAREVILPANWRDLAVVQVALGASLAEWTEKVNKNAG